MTIQPSHQLLGTYGMELFYKYCVFLFCFGVRKIWYHVKKIDTGKVVLTVEIIENEKLKNSFLHA